MSKTKLIVEGRENRLVDEAATIHRPVLEPRKLQRMTVLEPTHKSAAVAVRPRISPLAERLLARAEIRKGLSRQRTTAAPAPAKPAAPKPPKAADTGMLMAPDELDRLMAAHRR